MAHNIEIHSGYRGTQQERIDAARALASGRTIKRESLTPLGLLIQMWSSLLLLWAAWSIWNYLGWGA